MNELKNTVKTESSAVETRRSFLRKAGVTTLVASLPTQSVWGTTCTVSGNMSGNMSSPNATCVVKGWSPNQWHSWLQGQGKNGPRWRNRFHSYQKPFNFSGHDGRRFRRILENHNYNNEMNCCLIAAYYNADTGKYPMQPGVTAEQYVQDLYDEAKSSSNAYWDLMNALKATWS